MNNISRREFIKIAGLFGGASLFAGCDLMGDRTRVPSYIRGAPAVDPLEIVDGVLERYGVCDLCPGGCGISGRISSGSLVKIGGNPYHPVALAEPLSRDATQEEALKRSASICAVGGSGIQTLYDPFRIAAPLKRVGPRGSGKWEAISWKQAYMEIIHGGDLFGEGRLRGLGELKGKENGLGLLTGRIDWSAEIFLADFLNLFPGAAAFKDSPSMLTSMARRAASSLFGPDSSPVEADYANARFVLNVGSAPLDSGIPIVGKARLIMDARMRPDSFQWVVVDPRLSTTASKSDMWVPIKPGGDRYLALGVMRVLADKRASDPLYRVQFPDHAPKDMIGSLDLDQCAASSGVSKEKIAHIADSLVKAGPRAAVIPGPGVFAQPGGLETGMMMLWLNLFVGSKPGTGGLISGRDPLFRIAQNDLNSDTSVMDQAGPMESTPEALIIWRSDPAYTEPAATREKLLNNREIGLLISIDQRISQTGAISDYILPDTTYLERWDICRIPPFVKPDQVLDYTGFATRRPMVGVIDQKTRNYYPIIPGTRIMEEIFLGLGARLRLEGFEPPKGEEKPPINAKTLFHRKLKAITRAYNEFPTDRKSRLTAQEALKRGVVWKHVPKEPSADFTPHFPSTVGDFATPALNPKELTLIVYTLPFHRSPYSGVNSWLLEIIPENRAMINPEDARKRDIEQGQEIEIKSVDSMITLRTRAQVAPGVRPGVIAIASGFGYDQYGANDQIIDQRLITGRKERAAGVNPSELAGKAVLVTRVWGSLCR